MNEILFSLRLILINILITITLLSILYSVRKFIDKNLITKILFGFIFGIGLMIIIHLSGENDSQLIFYDARFSYVAFLTIYFNYISLLIGLVLVLIQFSLSFKGIALVLQVLSVVMPIVIIYVLKRVKDPSKTKYSLNLLVGFCINSLLFILVLIYYSVDIGDVIALLILNPFIYAQSIKIVQLLNLYFKEIDLEIMKNKLYAKALDSTNEFEIYILDKEYKYLYFNKYHKTEMEKFNEGKTLLNTSFIDAVLDRNVKKRLKKNIDLALSGKEIAEIILIEDGNQNYLEEHYTPIYNKDGVVDRVSIFSHNISEQVNYGKQIYMLSNYDSLTNFLNRRSLNRDTASYEVVNNLTVVFFDVNNLKFINDVFGHVKGDELLREVANEINRTYGSFASIYRIGGDEFIVVYSKKKHKDLDIANLVRHRLSKKEINKIPIMVSFGVAKRIKNQKFDELVSQAEDHMYQRKLINSKKELANNIQIIYKELLLNKIINEKEIDELINLVEVFRSFLEMDKTRFNKLSNLIKYHKIGLINDNLNTSYDYIESSFRILQTSEEFNSIAQDTIHLYENFDGSGRPQKLKGLQINENARVFRIVKDYYKLKKSNENSDQEIVKTLEENSSKIYDPYLLKKFLDNL